MLPLPEFLNALRPAKSRELAEIAHATSALPMTPTSVPVEEDRSGLEEERPPAKVCRLEGGRVYGTKSFERPKSPPRTAIL